MPAAAARAVSIALMALAPFAASANPAHESMMKMSESRRNEAFTEYMKKNGEPCKVERTFFQGAASEDAAVWSIACTNKKSFAVMLIDDAQGSTRFVECEKLKAGSKRECFKKY